MNLMFEVFFFLNYFYLKLQNGYKDEETPPEPLWR